MDVSEGTAEGGKTQGDALEALVQACTVFVKAMLKSAGPDVSPARLVEVLASAIHAAFNNATTSTATGAESAMSAT